MTFNLEQCLLYIKAAATSAPDRSIPLRPVYRPPVIAYTDASDEGGEAKLGGIVYVPGQKPHVMMYTVPPPMRALWGEQKTIINQAELVAVPILALTMADLFRHQDVIWFIDNTSAEAALIKAGSPTESMCRLALEAAAILAGLGARVWYEHVPSADNPADVLSREALRDPALRSKIEVGEWVLRDPLVPQHEYLSDFESFGRVLEQWQRML